MKARRMDITSLVCTIALEMDEFIAADIARQDTTLDVARVGNVLRRLEKKSLFSRREVVRGPGWLYHIYRVKDIDAIRKLAQRRVVMKKPPVQRGDVKFQVRYQALLLGEFTIADVVRETNLNKESISTEVYNMRKQGLLTSEHHMTGKPGGQIAVYKLTTDFDALRDLVTEVKRFGAVASGSEVIFDRAARDQEIRSLKVQLTKTESLLESTLRAVASSLEDAAHMVRQALSQLKS